MSTTTSRPVKSHDPMPVEVLINLSYRAAVARAAELVRVTIGELPLSLRLNAAPETLAITRTVAALLLSELDAIEGACPACTTTSRALDCAAEIGALEGRLTTVADQVRLALSWRLARPAAAWPHPSSGPRTNANR